MRKVIDYALEWLATERPVGVTVGEDVVVAQCVAATRHYAGYAGLKANSFEVADDATQDTQITLSEWALIRPLFILLVEREVALNLEASRAFGADPYGRQSSEIELDIKDYLEQLPRKNFLQPILSLQPVPVPGGGTDVHGYRVQVDPWGFMIRYKP